MWHGWGKPLISSFSQKFRDAWLNKNFTWDSRRGEEKLGEGLSRSTSWDRSISSLSYHRSLGRPPLTSPSLSSASGLRFQVKSRHRAIESKKLSNVSLLWKWSIVETSPSFSSPRKWSFYSIMHHELLKKTWKWRFSSPVSHLVFIVLWPSQKQNQMQWLGVSNYEESMVKLGPWGEREKISKSDSFIADWSWRALL